ncbi:MAG: alpha/beta hydrolase [Bacteroidales bacterium]|nr:alpha/beta hydrolase [Bacteroidales bacterium]
MVLAVASVGRAQEPVPFIPLWEEGKIPNSTSVKVETQIINERLREVGMPGVYEFMPNPEMFTGTAIVVCPGGGYTQESIYKEGFDIAKYFNSKGIAAYVLYYRLPQSKSVEVSYKAPVQDALRAIRKVRQLSQSWRRNTGKVGIIGFSAGGHLAANAGTLFKEDWANVGDALDTLSSRPDFMALIYPVISMGEITHMGSRISLLGRDATQELIDKFSNEKNVTRETPPTILVHAVNDGAVPVNNSIFFLQALRENRVTAAMHLFTTGGHGFGITLSGETAAWPGLVYDFLVYNNMLQ